MTTITKNQADNSKLSQHIVSVLETRTRTHLRVSVRIKSRSSIVIIVLNRIEIGARGGGVLNRNNPIGMQLIVSIRNQYRVTRVLKDRCPVVSNRDKSYQNATTRNRTYQNVKFWQNVPINCDLSIVAFVTDRALCFLKLNHLKIIYKML